MTKEEKEAIEIYEEDIRIAREYYENEEDYKADGEYNKVILLNLIEKQEKEIEDWKDVCHSLTDEEQLENKIKLFAPSIKALNQEGATKEKEFLSKLTKYYKTLLKEKKQIFEEMKRRNEKCD